MIPQEQNQSDNDDKGVVQTRALVDGECSRREPTCDSHERGFLQLDRRPIVSHFEDVHREAVSVPIPERRTDRTRGVQREGVVARAKCEGDCFAADFE